MVGMASRSEVLRGVWLVGLLACGGVVAPATRGLSGFAGPACGGAHAIAWWVVPTAAARLAACLAGCVFQKVMHVQTPLMALVGLAGHERRTCNLERVVVRWSGLSHGWYGIAIQVAFVMHRCINRCNYRKFELWFAPAKRCLGVNTWPEHHASPAP